MSCNPVNIHLNPDAIPYAVHTPILVPFHWKVKVKAKLDKDIKDGFIEPVPGGAVSWCSPNGCN